MAALLTLLIESSVNKALTLQLKNVNWGLWLSFDHSFIAAWHVGNVLHLWIVVLVCHSCWACIKLKPHV